MNATDAFRSLSSGIRFNKKNVKKPSSSANPDATTSKLGLNAASPEYISASKQPGSVSEVRETDSNAVRRAHKIRCTGDDTPAAWSSFSAFPSMPQELLDNLLNMGVSAPTPIQIQAPSIMLAGRDLLACAPTGSGKTLSFLLPLFMSCTARKQAATKAKSPVAIVVEPTRELARQVFTEAAKIKAGTSWRIQLLGESQSEEGLDTENDDIVDLIITTPLKLVFAAKENELDLSSVTHLVLDEADRMFELGFLEQTDEIIAACNNPSLHKAMFSATVPSGVEELAKSVMGSDMIRVIIGGSDAANRTISQDLTFTGSEDGKLVALKNLIKSGGLTPPALIFVQSVYRAKELNRELVAYNIKSESMHAERSKEDRDKIVQRFAEGKIWVLVCTDVMSRGVDFRGVELVINYDFPQSVQSYIHRIGRTGRAQRAGKAITFFTKDDASYLRSIVNVMRNSGCEVPEWMLSLKAPSQNAKKQLRRKPVERKDVSRAVGSIGEKRKSSHKAPRTTKKHRTGAKEDGDSSDFSEE